MSEENEKVEYFTADGEKVEGVLSQEDVDKKLEEFKTENVKETEKVAGEHTEEVGKLKEEITTLQEEMEKLGSKDLNFQKLRKKKEETEEILKKVGEKYEGKIEEIKKEIKDEKINAAIKGIVGDDSEVHEKVRLHYDNFKGDPKDRKEMMERIENAYVLATGSKPESSLDSSIIGTGKGLPLGASPKGKISEDAKSVAEKLGIKDEELKKHKLI